ncbi:MAG: TIGR02206 family membrane protein [Saprospiraceae bacterium]
MESFYTDTNNFVPYNLEHFICVFVILILGWFFLYFGKYKWNKKKRWKYPILLSCAVYFTQLFKVFFRMYLGNFDHTVDLPLHLCNMLPLFMIIALFLKSRLLLSIIFFWILAGTVQSNITPDLKNVLPHYEAIRYWVVHMWLPILAVYTTYVLGFRYTYKDALRSAICLNVIAAIVYPINLLLGSNYLYLMAKPNADTIYNYLGPWPWYIISLELVMFVLFTLIVAVSKLFYKTKKDIVIGKVV